MPYRFAIHDQDYSDYSAGRVFYSQPGAPAFPIRLASEIFQRALHLQKAPAPISMYDPTCGGAYHLTALGFLHGQHIRSITASDVDPTVLDLARRNLGLLSSSGLAHREQEIRRMLQEFGKPSHAEALQSITLLRGRLVGSPPVETAVFQANVFDQEALKQGLQGKVPDLVFSDVPYGNMTGWQMAGHGAAVSFPPAIWQMLDSLRTVLSPHTIVAVAADKNQKIIHEGYRRIDHFQVGKRQVVLLTPIEKPA